MSRHMGDEGVRVDKLPLRWAPVTRHRTGRKRMICYRCRRSVRRTAKQCPRDGCVAFFQASIPPKVFCPAFDEPAKGRIKRIPTGLLELDAPQIDRYLDIESYERGKRRPKRKNAE